MTNCPRCGTPNPAGFKFCGNCAAPLEAEAPTAAERRKVVTVLFADVVGSTTLGEQRDPEAMRAVMARYFETLRRVLERHGGSVEKFIGDAVMAVFGHPVLHEDDALRAVRSADEMRASLASLNAELERDWGLSIQTRIGINTGQVVAGDGRSAETLVTGDAVNVAARLQGAAAAGETVIGDETYSLVRDAVAAEELPPLTLKGKELPVRAWRLASVRADAAGHTRRLDSPLVGREREKHLLDEAFDQAVRERTPVLFTLLGSAGVGKSRLVHEFLSGLGDRARILRGRCLPYGEGITYWPLAEVVKSAAGIRESDSPADARHAIESLCASGEHAATIASHVAAAIGIAGQSATPEELFWAVRRFLELLAEERPLVVVFDDIHWAEPTFLDLIEHISDWSRDVPILLLCVARPELLEARATWAGGKLRATTLLLQPLSEAEVAGLVANLLGATDLAAPVVDRVAAAAEGNPLFVEEYLAMLVDDGLLRREGERWVATGDLRQAAIPASIRSLLAARIDRLAAPERRVIERASVVGKVFWRGAVAELAPEPMRPEVGPSLLGLVRKELVRPDRSDFVGDDAFRFRHLLVRDAAYDALPKQERVTLHERFANWLERTAGERVAEYEEVIGYHLEQAHRFRAELGPLDDAATELGRRAGDRLAAAGHRAADRGDVAGARKLLERALALLPESSDARVNALIDLATAISEGGEFARAIALFDDAGALAERLNLASPRWRAIVRRAAYDYYMNPEGAMARSRPRVEAALDALEKLGDHRGAAEAWILIGDMEYYLGHLAAEENAALRAAEHARMVGDDSLELSARVTRVASMLWSDAPFVDVVAEADNILEHARALGRRLPEAQALGILGRAVAFQGRPDEGRRLIAESRSILHDLGRATHVAGSSQWAGMVEWVAGDRAAQERSLGEGAETLKSMGEQAMLSTSYSDIAIALHHLGRLEAADRVSREAETLTASDDVSALIASRVARARVLYSQGDSATALRLADEALDIADRSEYSSIAAWAREELSEVVGAWRGPAAARELLEHARDYYARRGAPRLVERLERMIGDLPGQGEAGARVADGA